MKILQISTGFDISFNGGITNYVRNISSKLQEFGHKVFVLYSKDSCKKEEYNYEVISIETQLYSFHLNSVLYNSDIQKIEEIVKKISPDIIHIHMMIDLPILVIEMFKKYSKVVISLHDYSYICNRIVLINRDNENCVDSNQNKKCNSCISYEETIDNRFFRGGIQRIKGFIGIRKIANSCGHHKKFLKNQEIFQKVNALIAVSNRVKDLYIKNGFTNEKFYVNHIGNYTAEDEFRKLFINKPNLKKNQEKIRFGFIGNLNKIKGGDVFLKIIENSTHEFHIYGGIADYVKEAIKRKKNVYYHGKYQHQDLVKILTEVHIGLVLPIWEDNAPQVVFEFLNANIPVIATKMGGIPDFIDGSNGFLFENNEEGINKAKQFINSSGIYDFYNNVVNHIEGTKKAEQHMNDLLEIYNSL
ncbi:glycosyltransferase [Capnocytophaga canimorsus]|uniref:glycosyltransferase n=1 Tax=Capnocytophaga canimorsus TaxID=28188 RepID=UPI001AC28865|nr:glycosyltransferase [Capnocytophaga canimorsus]GIM59045.1 hypothetical protein CAPN007_12530 [Capnocytophaga canimorsus]